MLGENKTYEVNIGTINTLFNKQNERNKFRRKQNLKLSVDLYLCNSSNISKLLHSSKKKSEKMCDFHFDCFETKKEKKEK